MRFFARGTPASVSPHFWSASLPTRQGLSYCDDGWLYETSGLNGQSKVRRIDPATFDVDASADLESQYFGEGSTCYRDAEGNLRLITLTWLSRTGFIYDPPTLERLREYTYETTPPGHEGWGITYDGSNQEFIVSDGSTYLYFWDRDTLAEKRRVSVTRLDGSMQNQLNELEYMDGLVCCNIWHSDEIICVDPMTGKSVREYGKTMPMRAHFIIAWTPAMIDK
jgi:glutamine cyclotransferase